MSRRLAIRPQAHADLVDIARQIARDNVPAALAFWDAVESTYRVLLEYPESGTRLDLPELPDLQVRRTVVSGFRTYVAYYRVTGDGVEVIRLLHGARERDWIIRREVGL